MASNVEFIEAEVKFTNRKAARAVRRIAELAAEIAEDYPWSDEAREMLKAAMYVTRNVVVDIRRKGKQ
jgi:hypothetical protein